MNDYIRMSPTNWDNYHHNRPSNPLVRWLFLNVVVNAYKGLLTKATLCPHPSIIELGSGTGYVTKELSLLLHSKNVTLVDFNPGMLDISREIFKNAPVLAKFIKADFFDLNIKEKFDLVHSTGVVEHYEPEKQLKLVKLHADLLTNGGYCIIYVPTPTPSYRFFRKIAEILGIWSYTDEVPLTGTELIDIVKKAGLTVLAVNYFWKNYYLSEVGIIAQKKSDN